MAEKERRFRLGKSEKEFLQLLRQYQYDDFIEPGHEDFINLGSKHCDLECLGRDSTLIILEDFIHRINSVHRTTFSRMIKNLKDKGMICALHDSMQSQLLFRSRKSRPFIYGRGKYKKLIGLTLRGIAYLDVFFNKRFMEKHDEEIRRQDEIDLQNFEHYQETLGLFFNCLQNGNLSYKEYLVDKLFLNELKDNFKKWNNFTADEVRLLKRYDDVWKAINE